MTKWISLTLIGMTSDGDDPEIESKTVSFDPDVDGLQWRPAALELAKWLHRQASLFEQEVAE